MSLSPGFYLWICPWECGYTVFAYKWNFWNLRARIHAWSKHGQRIRQQWERILDPEHGEGWAP